MAKITYIHECAPYEGLKNGRPAILETVEKEIVFNFAGLEERDVNAWRVLAGNSAALKLKQHELWGNSTHIDKKDVVFSGELTLDEAIEYIREEAARKLELDSVVLAARRANRAEEARYKKEREDAYSRIREAEELNRQRRLDEALDPIQYKTDGTAVLNLFQRISTVAGMDVREIIRVSGIKPGVRGDGLFIGNHIYDELIEIDFRDAVFLAVGVNGSYTKVVTMNNGKLADADIVGEGHDWPLQIRDRVAGLLADQPEQWWSIDRENSVDGHLYIDLENGSVLIRKNDDGVSVAILGPGNPDGEIAGTWATWSMICSDEEEA